MIEARIISIAPSTAAWRYNVLRMHPPYSDHVVGSLDHRYVCRPQTHERSTMSRASRLFSYALILLANVLLSACTSQAPSTAFLSEPSSESYSICSKYGFVPNTEALMSCLTKVSRLIREHEENERRCEGVRQQLLRPTPLGTFSSGFGTAVADANAAYRLCLNDHVPSPVQLELPSGQTVTCQQIDADLYCY